jgi:hypothetical protein
MITAEPVEVVSLALEFPAPQVSQIIDIVDMVKTVPVGTDQEFSGEKQVQFFPVGVGDACDAAGDAPFFCVMENGFNGGFLIAASNRIRVDTFSMEMRKNHSTAMKKSDFLKSPQEQVGKGIFAAPLRAGEQQTIIWFVMRLSRTLEIDHKTQLLCS